MEATGSTPALSLEERGRQTTERMRLLRESVDRLYWTLAGDFPACASVMKTSKSGRDGLEPLQNPDGTWHEIAFLPVNQPPVASIEASLRFLDEWEHDWVEHHERHEGAEYITYGELGHEDRPFAREMKEDGSWDEDSNTEFLNRCCGRDRPINWRDLTLHVAASTDSGFVTIKDFVSGNVCRFLQRVLQAVSNSENVAVHPWLMSLRDDLAEAKVDSPLCSPGPLDVALEATWIVDARHVPEVDIEVEDYWVKQFRPPLPMTEGLKEAIRLARAERLSKAA